MRIHLLAVGTRMPGWVKDGYDEYAKRFPRECTLELKEIAPGQRAGAGDIARAKRLEGERILAASPKNAQLVMLDVQGEHWTTSRLAEVLALWMLDARDVALVIGGPDGLSDEVRQEARQSWSLSRLTFPHGLVRVMVAEQLYRAVSLLKGHPYHRE